MVDNLQKALVSDAFQDINFFYGNRVAKRSGVPLINHIVEGLLILDFLGASLETMEAYCIHPLCQGDKELETFKPQRYSSKVVMLALEYRNIANKYLAHSNTSNIILSPIKEVSDMLIADKVQNKKDFLLYHFGKHENSERLNQYFNDWLQALNVSETKHQQILNHIKNKDTFDYLK